MKLFSKHLLLLRNLYDYCLESRAGRVFRTRAGQVITYLVNWVLIDRLGNFLTTRHDDNIRYKHIDDDAIAFMGSQDVLSTKPDKDLIVFKGDNNG